MLLIPVLISVLILFLLKFELSINKKYSRNPIMILYYIIVILLVNILTWGLEGWDTQIKRKWVVKYYFQEKFVVSPKSYKNPERIWQTISEYSFTRQHVSLTQHISILYSFVKNCCVSLLIASVYFVYTIFFFKIQFLKQMGVWFIVGMLYFWLMSGFNFFLKRYKYGKFTSAIQRFWKRTNTYFWLIEGFLMLLFFYYYLNSSQEPLYMYDFSSLNQEYLVSGNVIATNVIILSLVLYFMHFTMLRINSNNTNQLKLYILIISLFIFSSFFIETYQFYYVLSTFSERIWLFNEDENIWSVETDSPTLRTKHHYLLVCLIAKYWHFLFIFLSWVFFVMKTFERQRVTYVHFGVNLQNVVILYVLNLVCYAQWLKWVYRRFFDTPYTWFFTNPEQKILNKLFSEIFIIVVNSFRLNSLDSITVQSYYKTSNFWQVNTLATWKFL